MQSHPIRVLLIDDDEEDYMVVRGLLSDLSSTEFILKWVSDYGAALDAILSGEYGVCLLDYRIKERNGLELMQEAVSCGAKTPIVFLTDEGGCDLDLEAISKGADDWLPKGKLSTTLLERSIRNSMERQRKRQELIKAKRVIQALSECNHAVIHIEDEAELLHAICRIVVDVGGYRMAWVGYAEEDRDRTVTPVAQYGYEKGYLETVKVTWKDAERGRGPTGTCIRTGIPSIIRSVGSQAGFSPWKAEASKRGYASVIGLPLLLDGRKLGALTIYSPETDAFDTEEVEFLVKLSANLSYGIGVLRLRKAQMQAEESLKKANLDLERRVEERRQAEDALRASETRYRIVADNTYDWEYWVSPEGRFLYTSPSCRRITGYAASEFEADPRLLSRIIHPHDLPQFEAHIERDQIRSGASELELRIIHRNGTTRWIGHLCQPVFDDKGLFLGRRAGNRDITYRKKTEKALEESSQKLKFFAYSVAHDLKSPAIGVYGLTTRLSKHARDVLDEKGRAYCDQILKVSEHIAALVEKINIYIATKEAAPLIETINIAEILRILRHEFSAQLSFRRIDLLAPESEVKIEADRLSILRIFRNLIDNSLKYGGESLTSISIGYEDSESHHIFSVSDNGKGLKEADSKKIFGLFQRDETSRGVEGAGLGLAIVKEIAEQHGGRVWVEPGGKKGITFYLSISKTLRPL